ncbi:MAG TPA: hypothetical protein PLM98_00355 [Thiolinea sp.]|nr:hypothetical protein [Thiolinea sp.]
MKNKGFNYFLGLCLLAAGSVAYAEGDSTLAEETTGKVKLQTIRTQDRFGTIEEERVKAVASTVHYVPAGGGNGYNLIGSDVGSNSVKSAHSDSDEMMIPSWRVFAW